jgi:hypothetical protein
VLGWPKRCKLARVFLWEHSYKGLKLAQLLGQLGVFLTWVSMAALRSTTVWISRSAAAALGPWGLAPLPERV